MPSRMSVGQIPCHDVAVVGAGPAGSAAALALARAGFDVVMFEKAALPRYKTCGGGLLRRAFKSLPELPPAVVERSFHSVTLNFLGTHLNYTATRAEPIVYMTMRAELDNHLAQEATKAGVQLKESCAVKHVMLREDHVALATARENFRAKFVIAADGLYSVIARATGWPDPPALAPALEYELHLPADEFARFSGQPRFDFNCIEAGYGWVFPKRNHLSVGILSTNRIHTNLPARLGEYLQQIGITRVDRTEKHGYLIPLAPRRGNLACGRVLLTGDAAGLVDPVLAEGISHAILSGQLAARALIESRMEASHAAATYQSLLEENILRELRAGRFLSRILYHHPRVRDAALRLSGNQLCEFVTGVVMGERSYYEALRKPASYLKFLHLKN